MVNKFLFCVCVCVLQVTWRANGIVLYMHEGKVLMDIMTLTSKWVLKDGSSQYYSSKLQRDDSTR